MIFLKIKCSIIYSLFCKTLRNSLSKKFINLIKKKTIVTLILLLYLIKQKGDSKNEIIKLEHYRQVCEKGFLLNYKKIKNPKISIISAVYNRGKYLFRFIKSIQNQKINDLEIIFIDDFSNDNTIEIIENFQKIDERIKLIKHKKNKGTLISRNNGALKSVGEYLLFPDPDDMISNDILY